MAAPHTTESVTHMEHATRCRLLKQVLQCHERLIKHCQIDHLGYQVTCIADPKRCRKCDERFDSYEGLERHMKAIHPGTKAYRCPHCHLHTATRYRKMRKHVQDYHPGQAQLPSGSHITNPAETQQTDGSHAIHSAPAPQTDALNVAHAAPTQPTREFHVIDATSTKQQDGSDFANSSSSAVALHGMTQGQTGQHQDLMQPHTTEEASTLHEGPSPQAKGNHNLVQSNEDVEYGIRWEQIMYTPRAQREDRLLLQLMGTFDDSSYDMERDGSTVPSTAPTQQTASDVVLAVTTQESKFHVNDALSIQQQAEYCFSASCDSVQQDQPAVVNNTAPTGNISQHDQAQKSEGTNGNIAQHKIQWVDDEDHESGVYWDRAMNAPEAKE
ncbi:hypothetical protein IWZ01DRAFT_544848 [Phyllosticta capitalensis]